MKEIVLAMSMLMSSAGTSRSFEYREGQVWAYKVRAGDEGSILKIQKIEKDGPQRIYHISVIGFRLRATKFVEVLPHEPVSRETLDKSVTELRPDPGTFPSADAGIDEWRRAKGGVYTISVAETIEVLDETLSKSGAGS